MKLFQVWITGILGHNLILAKSREEIQNALVTKGYHNSVTISEVTPFTVESFPTITDYYKV